MSHSASPGSGDLASLRIDRSPPEREGGIRRAGRWILRLVILAAVAAGAVAAWRQWVTPLQLPEVETGIAVARSPSAAAALLTATGYVVAQRKAAVTPKIAGRLAELTVREGSSVRKGETIGRIENRDIAASLEEARRNLDVAKAAWNEAVARREEARLDYERQSRLLEQGVASQADYDGAEARYKVAVAQVDSAAAAVPRAEAAVTMAEVALRDTLIIAPFDGVITVKNSEIGEIVAPVSVGSAARGNSVVEIADMSSLEAEVDINESHIGRVREGQPAEILLDAFPDHPYRGVLRQIVPTANRQKATVEAKVAFREKGPEVLPEMSVRVTFLASGAPAGTGPSKTVRVFAPPRAITSRGGGPAVLVIEDGRASVRAVKVGPEVEGSVEILSGLRGGERLVLDPTDAVRDGGRVRIRSGS